MDAAPLIPNAVPSWPVLIAGAGWAGLLLAGLVLDILILTRLGEWRRRWSRAVAVLRSRPWTLRDATRTVFVLLALYGVAMLLLGLQQDPGAAETPLRLEGALFYVWNLMPAAVVLGMAALLVRSKGVSWEQAFGLRWRHVGRHSLQAVKYYLAFMPLFFLMALGYGQALEKLGFPVDRQPVIEMFTDPSLGPLARVYLALMAVLAAPLAEEILFRGIALPALLKNMRPWPAAVGLSLLFAAIHLHVPSLVPLFVASLAWTAGYILSGTLLVPVLMHALFNAVSLTVNLLPL